MNVFSYGRFPGHSSSSSTHIYAFVADLHLTQFEGSCPKDLVLHSETSNFAKARHAYAKYATWLRFPFHCFFGYNLKL